MAPFTSIPTQLRDLDTLADACAELGLSLEPKAKCRGHAGVTRNAAHVIKLKGPYDIAVEPSKEHVGTYDLTTDWCDGHVAKEVGAGFGRLLQTYGIHEILRQARIHGLRVTRRRKADGSVLVSVKGWFQ